MVGWEVRKWKILLGNGCPANQPNHKKQLPVCSYFKSINCSPHSLSENSGLVCLVWSQSDYEPVLTSFFFLFVGPFFLKRRFCFCFCFFPPASLETRATTRCNEKMVALLRTHKQSSHLFLITLPSRPCWSSVKKNAKKFHEKNHRKFPRLYHMGYPSWNCVLGRSTIWKGLQSNMGLS